MTTPKFRHALPQLSGRRMLTDSGLETTLIYLEGLDLPCFASFLLLASEAGCATLRRYFDRHAELAVSRGLGFITDTPTWRAATGARSSASTKARSPGSTAKPWR